MAIWSSSCFGFGGKPLLTLGSTLDPHVDPWRDASAASLRPWSRAPLKNQNFFFNGDLVIEWLRIWSHEKPLLTLDPWRDASAASL